jgi:hypothetical protein
MIITTKAGYRVTGFIQVSGSTDPLPRKFEQIYFEVSEDDAHQMYLDRVAQFAINATIVEGTDLTFEYLPAQEFVFDDEIAPEDRLDYLSEDHKD